MSNSSMVSFHFQREIGIQKRAVGQVYKKRESWLSTDFHRWFFKGFGKTFWTV